MAVALRRAWRIAPQKPSGVECRCIAPPRKAKVLRRTGSCGRAFNRDAFKSYAAVATGVHEVGKGAVYAGRNPGDVFNVLNVTPDFDYTKPERDTRLLFLHRKLADGDLYFVDNRNDRYEEVDASFRVIG